MRGAKAEWERSVYSNTPLVRSDAVERNLETYWQMARRVRSLPTIGVLQSMGIGVAALIIHVNDIQLTSVRLGLWGLGFYAGRLLGTYSVTDKSVATSTWGQLDQKFRQITGDKTPEQKLELSTAIVHAELVKLEREVLTVGYNVFLFEMFLDVLLTSQPLIVSIAIYVLQLIGVLVENQIKESWVRSQHRMIGFNNDHREQASDLFGRYWELLQRALPLRGRENVANEEWFAMFLAPVLCAKQFPGDAILRTAWFAFGYFALHSTGEGKDAFIAGSSSLRRGLRATEFAGRLDHLRQELQTLSEKITAQLTFALHPRHVGTVVGFGASQLISQSLSPFWSVALGYVGAVGGRYVAEKVFAPTPAPALAR